MSGEEYLARQYCAPKPYWRCVHELSGGNHYTYNEYWLDAVAKYIGHEPSAAAKQLHRSIEFARGAFRAKQNRIYGNRKVSETDGLEDIYRREDKACDGFNGYKEECQRVYLKALETGKIETQRARRRHRCRGEDCMELLTGRARFCDSCNRARNREAARIYRRKNQSRSVISYTREISPQNRAIGYCDTPYRGSCGSLQGEAAVFTGDRKTKMAQPSSPINGKAKAESSFAGVAKVRGGSVVWPEHAMQLMLQRVRE